MEKDWSKQKYLHPPPPTSANTTIMAAPVLSFLCEAANTGFSNARLEPFQAKIKKVFLTFSRKVLFFRFSFAC
jgi:hypothetical protein